MEVSEIKFCSGTGYNLKNDREKSDILKQLFNKYNISTNDSNFRYFSDRHLTNLAKYEHLITTLTQGTEYLLYLTFINNEPYSLFIDKKTTSGHKFPKIIVTNFRFAEDLYKDTIFDGELVRDYNGKWQFLINDLLVYKGKNQSNKYLFDKIKLIYKIFNESYINDDNIQLCSLKIKK